VGDVDLTASLRRRLDLVEQRLAAACHRSGRCRGDVRLIAVTKMVSAEVAAVLPGLGIRDLGESRPQELWRKVAALPDYVDWHLIGHLQRNKVRQTLPLVRLIHSVDSLRLLTALDEEAARLHCSPAILLEVNVIRDPARLGFAPEAVPGLAPHLMSLRHVEVRGLMTMAAFAEDPETVRPTFVALRELRDRLRSALGPAHALEDLSMGMSNDFEVAVEEGATLVRLGTILFEGVGETSQ